ncbi:hypothetical protein PIB30_086014 [Stylosanthes scabra]|uniref:Uncharacterized protein n=1 Tax=Stylosanthes scabra TaxID=79078 RepID=A0ABU6ZRN0_9FABA|nr:hypothetical protein [Stylosanthes scabra]
MLQTTFPEIGNTKSSSKIQHQIQTITSTSRSEALPTTDPNQDRENSGWLELEAARVEVAHRSPPKPPNLPLEGGDETRSSKRESGGNSSTPVRSGTEDGAIAKGERTLVTAGDEGAASLEGDATTDRSYSGWKGIVECRAARSAVVGASAKGNWTSVVATMTDGRLRARQLRQFILLMSPPLLAAVFPWDCSSNGEEQSRDGWKRNAESDRVATIIADGKKEVAGSGASMAERSGDRRAPWSGARCRMDVTSSSSIPSKLLRETEIGEGKLLAPILGLGFNWSCMIHAQNNYKQGQNSFAMGL